MKHSNFTENILNAPIDETICWCGAVSKYSILEAKRNGARSLDDIRRMTGACTAGRCKELNPRGRCCSIEIMQLLASDIE